jgi:precorrin-6B methylase 2
MESDDRNTVFWIERRGGRTNKREGHGFSSEPALSKRSAPKGADNASEKNPASAPEGRVSANDQRLTTNDRPARLADLGSGAGFPGIPIKLWAPDIALTLIESNHKKAAFLREVTRALTLTDIDIQNARAETLSPATFDFVTLRAVERFSSILPIAAALLASSGRLALLIASSQLGQAHSTLPHLHWQPPIPIPQSKSRLLVVGLTEPQ